MRNSENSKSGSLALAFGSWLLIVACSETRLEGHGYDGPELPQAEVGTVMGDSTDRFLNNVLVRICKIDDRKVLARRTDRSIDSLPGEHKFLLFHHHGGKFDRTVELTFTVEAGHTYLITFDRNNSSLLWVEDIATSQPLMNVKSSDIGSSYACF